MGAAGKLWQESKSIREMAQNLGFFIFQIWGYFSWLGEFWVARDLYYNLLTQFPTQSFDITSFSLVEDLGRADRNMSLILKIDLIFKWMKSLTFLLQ